MSKPTRKDRRELGDMAVRLTEMEERWARDGAESELRLQLNEVTYNLKRLFILLRRRSMK